MFKDEIAYRLDYGYPPVIEFLLRQNYLNDFTEEELEVLIQRFVENYLKRDPVETHYLVMEKLFLSTNKLEQNLSEEQLIRLLIHDFKALDKHSKDLLSKIYSDKGYRELLKTLKYDHLSEISVSFKRPLNRMVFKHFHSLEKYNFDYIQPSNLFESKNSQVRGFKIYEITRKTRYNQCWKPLPFNTSTMKSLFKKVKILDRVYYDFNLAYRSLTETEIRYDRCFLRYNHFWFAYRLLDKNPDCILWLPNFEGCRILDRLPYKLSSEQAGLTVEIPGVYMGLGVLEKERKRYKRKSKNLKKEREISKQITICQKALSQKICHSCYFKRFFNPHCALIKLYPLPNFYEICPYVKCNQQLDIVKEFPKCPNCKLFLIDGRCKECKTVYFEVELYSGNRKITDYIRGVKP